MFTTHADFVHDLKAKPSRFVSLREQTVLQPHSSVPSEPLTSVGELDGKGATENLVKSITQILNGRVMGPDEKLKAIGQEVLKWRGTMVKTDKAVDNGEVAATEGRSNFADDGRQNWRSVNPTTETMQLIESARSGR